MLTEYLILLVSLIVAVAFSFRTSYFRSALVLVPLYPDHPLPLTPGAPIPFRFSTYGDVDDETVYKPRLLLALVIFSVMALVLNLAFNLHQSWDFVIYWSAGIVLASLLMITTRSLVMFGILALAPPLVLHWGLEWVNYTIDIFWLVLLAGALPGLRAGMTLSKGYYSVVQKTELQLADADGRNAFKAGSLKFSFFFLKAVPWLIVYQVVSYWWPTIKLGNLAVKLSSPYLQYPLLFIALLVGVNLAWYILPIFRETLTFTNVEAAGEFSSEYRDLEERAAKEEKDPMDMLLADRVANRASIGNFIGIALDHNSKDKEHPKNEEVNNFLGEYWEWLAFQRGQMVWLVALVMILLLRIFGEFLDLSILGNLASYPRGNSHIELFVQFAASVTFWANAMFLIEMINFSPALDVDDDEDEDDDEDIEVVVTPEGEVIAIASIEIDASEEEEPGDEEASKNDYGNAFFGNVDILWEASFNPDLVVTCEIVDTEATLRVESDVERSEREEREAEEEVVAKEVWDQKKAELTASLSESQWNRLASKFFGKKHTLSSVKKTWWFRASLFLLFGGIAAIIGGALGYSTIGAGFSKENHEAFGFPGSTVEVSIGKAESLGARWAGVSCSLKTVEKREVITQETVKPGKSEWTTSSKKPKVEKDEEKTAFRPTCSFAVVNDNNLRDETFTVMAQIKVVYPVQATSGTKEITETIRQKVKVHILNSGQWMIHETSRYTMASGIFAIIFMILILGAASFILKAKDKLSD